MLTHEQVRTWYGWAELSPGDPIVAGSMGRWRIIYHVGHYGIAAGGSLKLVFPASSDWPALQGRDPYAENFATVSTAGRARLAWRYDPRGHVHPWPKALCVDVSQCGLAEGETVTFYLGDPEGGSPGVRAQTFSEPGYTFRVLVDPFATGQYVPVPSPSVDIVGGEASRLELIVPSYAAVGAPFAMTIRLLDRWGNPARDYAGLVRLQGLAALQGVYLTTAEGGIKRVTGLRIDQPGVHRVRGREETLSLEAESNPIVVEARGQRSLLPLWGDLHGASAEARGARLAGSYFRHARDVAALDFCSYQADASRVASSFWQELQALARAYDRPGRFVAMPGYKWAGSTAGGGTRHVLFRQAHAPLHRCSHGPGQEGASDSPCYPLPALYQALRGQGALLIAGAGSPPANLAFHDPALDSLVEVYSSWGESPWLLEEALQRGHCVGFVACGGDPRGLPGASCPGAGEMVGRGGLTCVYVEELSREAVWEALRARRCYATTGARLFLDVRADGHTMGEVYQTTQAPRFQIRIAGTAEIERVEVHRGGKPVYRYPTHDPGRPGWVRVVWGGAMAREWPRHVPWDGTLHCRGATIRSARPHGFDSPARGIVLANGQSVSWSSLTAGNENGVLLELTEEADALLEIHVPLATLTVPLSDLPFERDLGGENLHLRVERLPRGTESRDLELAWTEPEERPGVSAYHVVVLQADGSKAWSSPIYVERA